MSMPMSPTCPFALIIEDHREVAESMCRVLERMGVAATIARDGEAALKYVEAMHFDLIIVDILLPRVNGFEVVRAIRLNPHLRAVPVMIVSCVTDPEAQAQGAAMGAVHYLCKPFEMFEFQARVEHILKGRMMRSPPAAVPLSNPDDTARLKRSEPIH
jgi:DNA-binding response OmpR family regulator